MPWPELLDKLTAAPASRPCSGEPSGAMELLDAIRTEQPLVVWYPGSGEDFTPLLFASADAPDECRLGRFLTGRSSQGEANLVVWMNDLNEKLSGFPEQDRYQIKRSEQGETVRVEKVGRFDIPLASPPDGPPGNHLSLTVFQATVGQGAPVTVLFSSAESRTLLECVLLPYAVPTKIVAIINQSSFGAGRPDFNHYTDLPKMLSATDSQMVEAYLIDNRNAGLVIPGYSRTGFDHAWGMGGTDLWRKRDGNPKRQVLAALE